MGRLCEVFPLINAMVQCITYWKLKMLLKRCVCEHCEILRKLSFDPCPISLDMDYIFSAFYSDRKNVNNAWR